jgi:hypothetical protein
MYCPRCDQKPMNCECTALERRMHAEIEDLREQVPQWIPVSERLPEPCEQVLCYAITGWTPGWEPQVLVTSHNGHGYWDCDSMTVTHWMPIPAPPTDGK